MRHQSQNTFLGIFIVIPQHQKSYLIYVPSTGKIVSSHDIVFDKTFSSTLAYIERQYLDAVTAEPVVLYILHAASSHEQNVDITTFAQFEQGNLG